MSFRTESWDEFWPDAEDLLREEYDEHARALKLWKPPVPDTDVLAALVAARRLVVMTARVNGAMGAYLGWLIDADLESKGHVLYRQGSFYASERFAKHSLGMRLLRNSLRLFRAHTLEPIELDLHHPPLGRGARLERVFEALGATKVAVHYRLKVSRKG